MTVNPIERLDRQLPDVEADAKRLALQAAYRHRPEPLEAEFAALACTHPEACDTDATYPGWAAHIAAIEAKNQKTRARKEASR